MNETVNFCCISNWKQAILQLQLLGFIYIVIHIHTHTQNCYKIFKHHTEIRENMKASKQAAAIAVVNELKNYNFSNYDIIIIIIIIWDDLDYFFLLPPLIQPLCVLFKSTTTTTK